MTLAKSFAAMARLAAACVAIAILGLQTPPESHESLVPMFGASASERRDDDAGRACLRQLSAERRAPACRSPNWTPRAGLILSRRQLEWPADLVPGSVGTGYVHVNALRIGPDGKLWIVDAGAPGMGQAAVKRWGALVPLRPADAPAAADLRSCGGVHPYSYIDDVRFNGRHAYITDAGAPGLIVLDLQTGAVRRVLDNNNGTAASGRCAPMAAPFSIPRGSPCACTPTSWRFLPMGNGCTSSPPPAPWHGSPRAG